MQCAHLQEASDAGRSARRGERSNQLNVGTRERRPAGLVQYSHKVYDRIRAGQQARERHAIEDVGFDHLDRRQQDQVLGRLAAARGHDDVVSGRGESGHQVAADESAAAHDDDALRRAVHSALAAIGSFTVAPRGATIPKRAVRVCGAAPNACA